LALFFFSFVEALRCTQAIMSGPRAVMPLRMYLARLCRQFLLQSQVITQRAQERARLLFKQFASCSIHFVAVASDLAPSNECLIRSPFLVVPSEPNLALFHLFKGTLANGPVE